jgi:hypothetical protein
MQIISARTRAWRLRAGVLLAAALARPAAAQCPPGAPAVLVNEVLYDATGDDAGHEFLELLNVGPAAASLAGLRIEAGDGSGAGRWTLRWQGGPGDSVAPGARFVVGGALVQPPPDCVADLNLQNGPDAVRLVWPDGGTEVVGWGALEFTEYFCGAAAADAPSGLALARRPDGVRRGSNAADFEAVPPSPGAPNQAGRDVAWVAGAGRVEPESPAPGQGFTLHAALVNRGRESLVAGEVSVRVWARESGGDSVALLAGATDRGLAPGDTAWLALPLIYPRAAKLRLYLLLRLAGDELPAGDRDSLTLRIGPGPLAFTEICFQPPAGEPEWVEVRAREAVATDGWLLADLRDSPGRVGAPAARLEAESLAVLTQDRVALLTRRAGLDSARVWQVSPWSALNNTDGPEGIADRVTLREPDGTPSDAVSYSATGVPAGGSLERGEDGEWRPIGEGTPLRPPRPLPAMRARWEVEPQRWRLASGQALALRYALPWPAGRAAADLYDLGGRLRARLVPERETPARGEWRLDVADARGLMPGYYLVVLRARARSGGETLVERRVLRVEGGAP